MSKEYMFRKITDEVDEAISAKFDRVRFQGQMSPRQVWGRGLIDIGALETEVSILCYALWQRSLQIAAKRGDSLFRDEKTLHQKYEREIMELDDVLKQRASLELVGYRLSNVIYYLVQIYASNGALHDFLRKCEQACEKAGIPLLIALLLANKKFESRGRRAAHNLLKDPEDEYRRMRSVLDTFCPNSRLDVQRLADEFFLSPQISH